MKVQNLAKLKTLQLRGMAKAYEDQFVFPDVQAMPFDQRFGILVDQEEIDRKNRRYQGRLKAAKLREKACIEDMDFAANRNIDKGLFLSLAAGDWIEQKQKFFGHRTYWVRKNFYRMCLGA